MRKLRKEYGAYRCTDCNKLTADVFIREHSVCVKCGGQRFRGAAKFSFFEGLVLWSKLQILEVTGESK